MNLTVFFPQTPLNSEIFSSCVWTVGLLDQKNLPPKIFSVSKPWRRSSHQNAGSPFEVSVLAEASLWRFVGGFVGTLRKWSWFCLCYITVELRRVALMLFLANRDGLARRRRRRRRTLTISAVKVRRSPLMASADFPSRLWRKKRRATKKVKSGSEPLWRLSQIQLLALKSSAVWKAVKRFWRRSEPLDDSSPPSRVTRPIPRRGRLPSAFWAFPPSAFFPGKFRSFPLLRPSCSSARQSLRLFGKLAPASPVWPHPPSQTGTPPSLHT